MITLIEFCQVLGMSYVAWCLTVSSIFQVLGMVNCIIPTMIGLVSFAIITLVSAAQMSWGEDDTECLRAFKNSVQDPKGALRDWSFSNSSSNDLCWWNGVQCWNVVENKVRALILGGAALHSPAPFSLTHLAKCFSLEQVDLSHNRFEGPIPEDLCMHLPFLTQLDMSDNQLVGSIPASLGDCSYLSKLYLNNNLLSGTIPWQLGALPHLRALRLSDNHLSGIIPSSFASTNRTFPASAFANNSQLCGPPLHSDVYVCTDSEDSPRFSPIAKILLMVGTPMLVVFIVVVVCACYCWLKGMRHRASANNRGGLQNVFQPYPCYLTWDELHTATKGFSKANIVGYGGSSTVFKGRLKDGHQIAVKLMTCEELGLVYTPKELFLTELNVLSKLRHRNLVRILGYSFDSAKRNMAIILDYVPMGSLDKLLHGSHVLCEDELPWRSPSPLARWKIRVNILLGIGEGLAYLHHDYDRKVIVIHGDLKPSNVLLDQDMEAHIADFGLARIVGAINSTTATSRGQLVHTPYWSVGYTAPECVQQGVVSRKADVFSFGIIVLEVMTGKRPSDNGLEEGESLVKWVSKAVADGVLESVVAPALSRIASNQGAEANLLREDMKAMLRMGCQCASTTHATRPNMCEVVALLRQLRDKSVSDVQ